MQIKDRMTLRIPRAVAFDALDQNRLRCPWVLTDWLPGRSLNSRWIAMQIDAKRELVRQIALLQYHVRQRTYGRIGSLTLASRSKRAGNGPLTRIRLVETICHSFPLHIVRGKFGPYQTSAAWFEGILSAVQEGMAPWDAVAEGVDKFFSEGQQRACTEMRQWAREEFSSDEKESCSLDLRHVLVKQNLIVDEQDRLVGVIGLDQVDVRPDWAVCEFPDLLWTDTLRLERPHKSMYLKESTGTRSKFQAARHEHDTHILRTEYRKVMRQFDRPWQRLHLGGYWRRELLDGMECAQSLNDPFPGLSARSAFVDGKVERMLTTWESDHGIYQGTECGDYTASEDLEASDCEQSSGGSDCELNSECCPCEIQPEASSCEEQPEADSSEDEAEGRRCEDEGCGHSTPTLQL